MEVVLCSEAAQISGGAEISEHLVATTCAEEVFRLDSIRHLCQLPTKETELREDDHLPFWVEDRAK